MQNLILITGARSGFGELAAKALATAGHIVYASLRDVKGKGAKKVAEYAQEAKEKNLELFTVELDTSSDKSVAEAVKQIVADQDRLDVVIHNAGHMSFGPIEAFTPEQIASLYDDNVVGTQRVIVQCFLSCGSKKPGCSSGIPAAARREERHPIWDLTLRPRQVWTLSPLPMRVS